jgi:hypothetical protein
VKARNFVLAMIGTGLALGGLAAPAASADTSGDVSVQDVHRLSAACASPSGKKINISWGDGHQSVTVYYNNHCNQARAIELTYRGIGGIPVTDCFVAPANKKDNKVMPTANPSIVTITTRGRC